MSGSLTTGNNLEGQESTSIKTFLIFKAYRPTEDRPVRLFAQGSSGNKLTDRGVIGGDVTSY